MAYCAITKPSLHFSAILYTGSGSAQDITVGFQPDLVWFKNRTYADHHNLVDRVRWTSNTNSTHLSSNQNNAAGTKDIINSFASTGFNLETGDRGHNSSDGDSYVSWNWKAGNSAGSSNTDGTINTTATSANTTAGFSISTYTGNATQGATLGHGLGVKPSLIIIKSTSNAEAWVVGGNGLDATNPFDYYLHLHTQDERGQNNNRFGNVLPTTSVFSLGNEDQVNSSSKQYVAYCFADIPGYQKSGKYMGQGNANGQFINCGFKPALVMAKRVIGGSEDWNVWDNKRIGYNVDGNDKLYWNLNSVESTGSTEIDILSNGFKWRTTNAGLNGNDVHYLYYAVAEEPFVANVGTNGIPATAR